MPIRLTLPELADLEEDCLAVPGPVPFDRDLHQQIWIAPSDAELERRRYPIADDFERARSLGNFGDADDLFFKAPQEERRVFHPCPWGAHIEAPDDPDVFHDGEERVREFAGAVALLLREHAPGVGATCSFVIFGMPTGFGFVTYGTIPDPAARAAALCSAYVAVGKLPPSALAVAALQNGPMPDETPEVVKAAVKRSIEVLADRVANALANAGSTDRPSPSP